MPIESSDVHRVTRDIPVPSSISAAARQNLQAMMDLEIAATDPPEDDAGWEALIAFTDEMLLAMLPHPAASTTVEPITVGGVPAYDVDPGGRSRDLVCLYVHGGGLTMGGGEVAGRMTALFAEGAQVRSIGVDYRMPPRHPYPAPLDDCVAAYRGLLEHHDASRLVVAGASAGGNLAPALVLRARDEGLPLPAGVVLQTPEVDLTESGDSFETNMGIDPVLRARLGAANRLYAGGHDLADPYLSPLFGDLSAGFPPTFLQTGTRDLFLSNTVRFHRALRQHGVRADLHVWEAMPHGGFGAILEGGPGQVPEDKEIYEEVRRFLASLW